jgi:hypothetical protein
MAPHDNQVDVAGRGRLQNLPKRGSMADHHLAGDSRRCDTGERRLHLAEEAVFQGVRGPRLW